MEKLLYLAPIGALIAGYGLGKLYGAIRDRVNAIRVDLNNLDDLDFDTPCNVGPEGVYARTFEQCTEPATWDVEVHRCDGNGNETHLPVVLCDNHLAIIAEALTEYIDQHGGELPCGKHADSVFDLVRATRI